MTIVSRLKFVRMLGTKSSVSTPFKSNTLRAAENKAQLPSVLPPVDGLYDTIANQYFRTYGQRPSLMMMRAIATRIRAINGLSLPIRLPTHPSSEKAMISPYANNDEFQEEPPIQPKQN